MLFFFFWNAGHAQYNVRRYSKHEILLLDTCLLHLYFTPDWLGKYLDTYQNNMTQNYSEVSYDI